MAQYEPPPGRDREQDLASLRGSGSFQQCKYFAVSAVAADRAGEGRTNRPTYSCYFLQHPFDNLIGHLVRQDTLN